MLNMIVVRAFVNCNTVCWCAWLDSNQHCSPSRGDASCRWATRARNMADGARIERAHPCGLGALPTHCIASLPTVLIRRDMADGDGIEPPRPCGRLRASNATHYHSGNHPQLSAYRLLIRPAPFGCWRKARDSNPHERLPTPSRFRDGGRYPAIFRLSLPGAPSWIRTSNLRLLRAAPLPDWTTGAASGLERCAAQARAGDKLSDNSASYLKVGIGSQVGP